MSKSEAVCPTQNPDELIAAAAAEVEEIQRKEPLTFVLVGKAGVGKSSTVNTLMGREVAKTSDERVTTADVTKYEGEFDGIKLNIFDTPGLADTTKRDEMYLENIRDIAKPQDVLLYVRPLYETRLLQDDENAIRRVTGTFGPSIWGQTVLVLTFADMYPDRGVLEHKTNARAKETRSVIASAIQDYTAAHSEEGTAELPNAEDIPAVAFSNTQLINPWGRRYLTLLYTAVIERISSRGSMLFLIATAKRLKAGMEAQSAVATGHAPSAAAQAKAIFPDADLQKAVDVRIQTDIMGSAGLTVAFGALGATLAPALSVTIGVGAAIGAGVGAIFSFFSWIADKIKSS
jgi:hypothetical protein